MGKQKKKSNGFVLRLIQAILYVFPTVFICVGGFFALKYSIKENSGWNGDMILFIIACITVVITVLQFVAAFAGRKRKWANVMAIVLSALGLIFGIFGIIGGAMGIKSLKNAAVQTEQTKAEAENITTENKEEIASTASSSAEVEEQAAEYESVQPKMGRKGKIKIMIVLTVSYALFLLCGILLAAVPSVSNILASIGICEQEYARAYGIAIGVMWVTLVPAFGYYFATISPFELGKKARILIAVVTTLLLVAMNIVFFVVIGGVRLPFGEGEAAESLAVKEFFGGSDVWFIPASTVFASLAIILCYLSFLFKGNGKRDGNAALKAVTGILSAKDKQPDIFILVASILLTWLAHFVAFVLAIIIIAIFIGIVIMFFLGVLSLDNRVKRGINVATGGDWSDGMKEYSFTNDMGCEQTVYSSDGRNFYSADGSYVGYSKDNGKTITQDK